MSATLTPDAEDPRAARHARTAAFLERASEIAAEMIERAAEASRAEAEAGAYDPRAEDVRARMIERCCRTLRRNDAYLERQELDDVAIRHRLRELTREKRQAVRDRAREVEMAVLEALDAGDPDAEASERLLAGLYDWIERHAWDDDFHDDPIPAVVRAACNDLGLDLTYEPDDNGKTVRVIRLPKTPCADSADPGPPERPCELAPAADAAKPP